MPHDTIRQRRCHAGADNGQPEHTAIHKSLLTCPTGQVLSAPLQGSGGTGHNHRRRRSDAGPWTGRCHIWSVGRSNAAAREACSLVNMEPLDMTSTSRTCSAGQPKMTPWSAIRRGMVHCPVGAGRSRVGQRRRFGGQTQEKAVDPFGFTSDAGLILWQVKPDAAAEFEMVWRVIRQRVETSASPEVRSMVTGMKMYAPAVPAG